MRKRKNKKFIIIILILFISIGFAYLSASLNITGLATIKRSVWDVHFENIVNENENVLRIDTPAVINNDKLKVNFEVALDTPGDEYSFYVDIVNKSTFDVMINNVTLNGLTTEQEEWIKNTVTYSDGISLQKYDVLKENDLESLRVSVKYLDDLSENNLPTIDQDFSLTLEITFNQADNNSKERNHLEYINRQTPGVISVGDEIAIGSEHFYVLSSTEEKTVLYTKRRLNIGQYKSPDMQEGIQKNNNAVDGVGIIPFSSTAYWLENGNLKQEYGTDNINNIYDSSYNSESGGNYSIAYYINNYVNRLNEIGLSNIKGRCITDSEVRNISGISNYNISMPDEVPQWLYMPQGTWVSSAVNNKVFYISSLKYYGITDYSSSSPESGIGIRPVIEVPSIYLNGDIVIRFDPNGGEVSQTMKRVSYNSTYGDLPTPTREGYTFLGWNGKNLTMDLLEENYAISNFSGRTPTTFLEEGNYKYSHTVGYTSEIDTLWGLSTQKNYSFSKNDTYYLSFYVRSKNCNNQSISKFYNRNYGKTGIFPEDTNNEIYKGIEEDLMFENDGKWYRLNAKLSIADNYENAKIRIGNDLPNLFGENCYIDVSRIMLEKGESLTDYEPYYIKNDTTVVQNKSHTLTAIWQEN